MIKQVKRNNIESSDLPPSTRNGKSSLNRVLLA